MGSAVMHFPLRLVVAIQGSVHDQGILRNLQIMYHQGLSLHLVCLFLAYLQHYYTTMSVWFIACSEQKQSSQEPAVQCW